MDNSFLHSKRLLLVDDEQELLKMVTDILKDAGFETILTAMSVKDAVLTAKEHALLETLARNAGKIVTVDALCESLWGDNPFGYENSLNAHVRRIREKIEINPSKPVSLITIKGLGYKLIARK